MLAGVAEMERNLIAERTTSAMQHTKDQRQVYSPVPYGFNRVGDDLRENPAEMAVIERVRRLRSEGVSLAKIAAKLNCWESGATRFELPHCSRVQRVLENVVFNSFAQIIQRILDQI